MVICDNCSLLISKVNGVSGISMKELPEAKKQCVARHCKNLAPGYPNNHIWGEKAIKILTEENGDPNSAILNNNITKQFYRFFIFDMITLKIALFSQYRFNYIYFWPDDQKHSLMWNSKFSWLLSEKCGNGNVSKVGAFFFNHPIYCPHNAMRRGNNMTV